MGNSTHGTASTYFTEIPDGLRYKSHLLEDLAPLQINADQREHSALSKVLADTV